MYRIILVPLMLLWACSNSTKGEFDLIITNVFLIDGTGNAPLPHQNIYIKSGKIIKIDAKDVIGKGERIDGTGKFIIPGLFDCHVHTTDYQRDLPKFIHYGITNIFITGGSLCTNEYYAAMRAEGNDPAGMAPRVFHTSQHFTMEGRHPVRTYPTPNWVDGETVFYLKDTNQIERLVEQVKQYPIQGIKLTIEDGPMPPWLSRMPQKFINKVAKEAHKNDLKVFAHVSDNLELKMVLHAGINNLLHFTGIDLDFEEDVELIKDITSRDLSWVTTLMIDKGFMYPLHPEWILETDISKYYSKAEIGDYDAPKTIERAKAYLGYFKYEYGIENPNLKNIMSLQVADIQQLYDRGVNMVIGTDTVNDFIGLKSWRKTPHFSADNSFW